MPAIIGSLLLSLVITGCTSLVQETEQNSPIVIAYSPTVAASATLVSTSTPLPLTDTPTPISLPLRNFTKHCLDVERATTTDFLSEGTIFLRDLDSDEILLLTNKDEEPRLLTENPEVTPDGVSQNWAWMFSGNSVIASNGDLVTTTYRNNQWGNLQGWLDSERIVFQGQTRKSNVLYIYNPFTRQEKIFAPNVTDRYQYIDREFSTMWPVVWKFVPDPTLTRMVYVRDQQGRPELVLIDLENGEAMWQLDRFSPGDRHIPVWSPDGSLVAVISDDYQGEEETYRWEVYIVNRDGQGVQWLDVSVKSGGLGNSVWGDQVAWSPDRRYIAFYGENLYILDTASRQAVEYCIPYTARAGDSINYRTPIIWSPDSRQVIFQPGTYQAVVIDIESNRAVYLGDEVALEPLGWIISP
jgi:dipeptidyl aminopeptidase/acylaminoacyl peptidase